jgi:hypothetical protein
LEDKTKWPNYFVRDISKAFQPSEEQKMLVEEYLDETKWEQDRQDITQDTMVLLACVVCQNVYKAVTNNEGSLCP